MEATSQQHDTPAFEELLASPLLQFDPYSELLPHLMVFGPTEPCGTRPWLFDESANTTATD